MAASTSGVCDEKKKVRKLSLSYLKNTFQKKSGSSICAETTSNDGNSILENISLEDREFTSESGPNRVTSSSSCEPERTLKDIKYNETNKDKQNGFFRNIKKRLHIKDLTLCKSKQKIKAIEPSSPSYSLSDTFKLTPTQLPIVLLQEKELDSNITQNGTGPVNGYLQHTQNISQNTSIDEENRLQEPEYISSGVGNVAEPQAQASSSRESEETKPDSESKNEKKFNLTEELLKLSKYGWYWGPISRDEADTKLANEPDGAFLVRDSSADKYLLTLSFKSSGKLLHTRVEHSGGLFSLYYHPECERFSSVVALINHSMSFSQSAVYCYSRPRYPGHPAFPVRLTKPVSRFTQVRSLQYLCRFVIRQNTRVDNIDKLPLPDPIREYIEEAHY
ncbi:suppressor of cytokine signaling 4 [Athalia rosae]|uniref:suppressor of cytokine signaling 4 n=1 Tax=Athalia rosae TaxID=37344 RepID=UPI000626DF28|nr:suppressor of cytokine signaling 4 [Athalia rosae]